MNQFAPNNQQPFKLKVPVIVLSFIALALGLARFIVDLSFSLANKEYIASIEITFAWISLVVYTIPFLVWFLFVLLPRNMSKATILVAIAAVFVAAKSVLYYVEVLAFDYGFSGFRTFDYIYDALILLTFIPAAIMACTGLSKKFFLIIAAAVGIVLESINLVYFFQNIGWMLEEGWYTKVKAFTWACLYLAPLVLYVAMLLFSAANDFTPNVSKAQSYPQYPPQYAPQQMTPDAELRMIYSQLQQGIITQEEYQARRAEIIRKL